MLNVFQDGIQIFNGPFLLRTKVRNKIQGIALPMIFHSVVPLCDLLQVSLLPI